MKAVTILKDLLKVLEIISRFKVNWDKATIAGINMGDIHSFASILGCKVDSWPIKYLRLLLRGHPH